MRKLSLLAIPILLSFFYKTAPAQEFDAAFGVGTTIAPSGTVQTPFGPVSGVSERGGAYPAFSADILLKHRVGISGEVAWRAGRNLYGGFQPYRPLLYDFGGIYGPKLGKHFTAELQGGIGFESLRFYQGFTTCSFTSCTDYVSSNHFMGHFGAGIRYYVRGHFFVRPEAHFYAVRNNVEFPSSSYLALVCRSATPSPRVSEPPPVSVDISHKGDSGVLIVGSRNLTVIRHSSRNLPLKLSM